MTNKKQLIIRRRHGLGNLLMLFPVLSYHAARGTAVVLETDRLWCDIFSELLPGIEFTGRPVNGALDLDGITLARIPSAHRTDEFAEILDAPPGLGPTIFTVPPSWAEGYGEFREAVLFSFEAAHPSRRWSEEHVRRLIGSALAADRPFVRIGLDRPADKTDYPDLRGRMSVRELLGLMGAVKGIVSMDSGALHLAAAAGLPALALFTGINPLFRLRGEHKVRVISTDLDCQPCNKNETCNGAYQCLHNIKPDFVFDQLSTIDRITGLETACIR